jgi:hypothetical protein
LFGDGQRRVVRQHDPLAPTRIFEEIRDGRPNGSRRTRHLNVVCSASQKRL